MAVSVHHQVPLQLFRSNPGAIGQLLALVLPAGQMPRWVEARVESAEFATDGDRPRFADLVNSLWDRSADGGLEAVLAVVLEAQLRTSGQKRRRWPGYVTGAWDRMGCPIVLVVPCRTQRSARWCAETIRLGPAGQVTPLALGPADIPVIVDPEDARARPELTILSGIAHGGDRAHRAGVLAAVAVALRHLPDDDAARYLDYIADLHRITADELEDLMTLKDYTFRSEWGRKYIAPAEARGRAEGEATAILEVLATRGITVPDTVRAEITACTDLDRLTVWLRRAVTAPTAADILD